MSELEKKQNNVAQPATDAELSDVSGGGRFPLVQGKVVCKQCGKVFDTESDLAKHKYEMNH